MALERRGKNGVWWYSFKFGGQRIHESSRSPSKTVAKEAEKVPAASLKSNSTAS